MNKVILSGRLTDVPYYTPNGAGMASMVLAIDDKTGTKPHTDFIRCKCFGKRAEFVSKYVRKGEQIIVVGKWNTDSYEKNGQTQYVNECLIDNIELIPAERTKQQEVKQEPVREKEPVGFSETDYGDIPF